MAWTGHNGTLAPGQVARWWYSFGGDRHAQFAVGNPLNPNAELLTYDFSKSLENNSTVYRMSIRNIGSFGTNYNLQGGGLT